MGKIRLGGFIFVSYAGDHSPRHVHIYEDGKRAVKWDVENWLPMEGNATRKMVRVLEKLREEGRL